MSYLHNFSSTVGLFRARLIEFGPYHRTKT